MIVVYVEKKLQLKNIIMVLQLKNKIYKIYSMNSEKKNKILEINRRTDINQNEKSKLIREVFKSINIKVDTIPKCNHYKRNCLIHCKECNKFYGCRLCHDENENHKINRFKIEMMKCKLCNTVQKCSQTCINCSKEMSKYYCNICHLFANNDNRIIKHCDKCGICRIGDNKHCDKCNMCFDISIYDTHNCIEETKYNDNCCICQQDLKTSRLHTTILKCNHLVHQECLNQYLKSNQYQCPLCKKSLIDMSNMWTDIENYVNLCQMPDEYKNYKVKVFCNDCEKRSLTKYHFTYNQCQECKGWNTEILETIKN